MKIIVTLFAFFITIISCNNQKVETTVSKTGNINLPLITDTQATQLGIDSPVIEPTLIDTLTLIKSFSKNILKLLKKKDYKILVTFFHPLLGVRFSPYGYIDTVKDQRLSATQFLKLIAGDKKITWGIHHGTGDPIVLSIPNYFASYVYDADFVNAEKKGYDKIIGKGNSLNNLFKIYPLAHFSESHFTGFDKKYAGMDWKSLRLVFQPYKNSLFLVAIIHDQWTS